MPPDNFTPNGAFEGYVYAKLEGIEARFNLLPCDNAQKRLSKVENDVSHMKGWAAGMGAIAGIVSAWVGKHILGK